MEKPLEEKLLPPPVLKWDQPIGQNRISEFNLAFLKDCIKLLVGYIELARVKVNRIRQYINMENQGQYPVRFQRSILQTARENVVNIEACTPIRMVTDSIVRNCLIHVREAHRDLLTLYGKTLQDFNVVKDFNDKILQHFANRIQNQNQTQNQNQGNAQNPDQTISSLQPQQQQQQQLCQSSSQSVEHSSTSNPAVIAQPLIRSQGQRFLYPTGQNFVQ